MEKSQMIREKDVTYIAASDRLRDALSEKYADQGFLIKSIEELQDLMLTDGGKRRVKAVGNYMNVRDAVEEYLQKIKCESPMRKQEIEILDLALKRNTYDIWRAIRMLGEAGIKPEDLADPHLDPASPIACVKEIWQILEKNAYVDQLRWGIRDGKDREELIKALEEEGFGRKLCFVGLYVPTPLQKRILNRLRGSEEDQKKGLGYEIEFLSSDEAKVPTDRIKIIRHHSKLELVDMIRDIRNHHSEDERIFAANSRAAEKIVKTVCPELIREKNFLTSPLGKYLHALYLMWDSTQDRVDIRSEYMEKCLESGFHENYLYEWSCAKKVFRNCHDIKNWRDHIAKLRIMKEAVAGFDEPEWGNPDQGRWHRLLGNPFNNFGIYAMDEKRFEGFLGVVERTLEDAERLFPEEDAEKNTGEIKRYDLLEHAEAVSKILKEYGEEAKELTARVKEELEQEEAGKGKYSRAGIRDAMLRLLEEKYAQDDQEDAKEDVILPLSDALILRCDEKVRKIHLILADELELPGASGELPWPLTDELLRRMKLDSLREWRAEKPYIDRCRFRDLVGVLPEREDVTLTVEWIDRKGDKTIEISPYVRMLFTEEEWEEKINASAEPARSDGKKEERRVGQDRRGSDRAMINDLDLQGIPDIVKKEIVEKDRDLCPYRFAFSYLLNYLPSYSSEFHDDFVVSRLLSAFTRVEQGIREEGKEDEANICKEEEIKDELLHNCFFYLSDNLRENAREYVMNPRDRKEPEDPEKAENINPWKKIVGKNQKFEWEGFSYPKELLMPHFLEDKAYKNAFKTGKKKCTWCPYKEVCLKQEEIKHE